MDPGAHDDAALANVSEGGRDERADGAKTMTASSSSGGPAEASPAQVAPSERASSWDSSSPARVPAKTPSLRDGDLAHDVRGRSGTRTDRLGVACEPQRAADQAGAEERRGPVVRVGLRDREAEAFVDHMRARHSRRRGRTR